MINQSGMANLHPNVLPMEPLFVAKTPRFVAKTAETCPQAPGDGISGRPDLTRAWLLDCLERSSLSQSRFAERIGYDRHDITRRIKEGSRPLEEHFLAQTLVALHALGALVDPLEALNALYWIGLGPQDVAALVEANASEGQARLAFLKWWPREESRRHSPLPRLRPAYYVRRRTEDDLVARITGMASYRQVEWRAVLLHGMMGAGKETLAAAAIEHPAVQAAFREGVIWIEAGDEAFTEHDWRLLCRSVGLDEEPPMTWEEQWRAWVCAIPRGAASL
jgi:hypothetical protein